MDGFFIAPFYTEDQKSLFNSSRPKRIEIVADNESFLIDFPDATPYPETPAEINFLAPTDLFAPEYFEYNFSSQTGHAVIAKKLRLIIKDVYEGEKVQDLCLAEVRMNLTRLRIPPSEEKSTNKPKTHVHFVCKKCGTQYSIPISEINRIKTLKGTFRCKLCGKIIPFPK